MGKIQTKKKKEELNFFFSFDRFVLDVLNSIDRTLNEESEKWQVKRKEHYFLISIFFFLKKKKSEKYFRTIRVLLVYASYILENCQDEKEVIPKAIDSILKIRKVLIDWKLKILSVSIEKIEISTFFLISVLILYL